jgi:hypothetical protein
MSKTSTVKESNTINMKTSNLSNIELTMNIKVPHIVTKNNSIFNDYVFKRIFSRYFEKGTYFKERLSWHESGTKLFINLAEIIYNITPKNDEDSLYNNSVTFITQIKYGFITEFANKLPAWLNPLGWKCSEIKISTFNSTQFCGFDYTKDTEKGTAMYGVPAFMLILYIDPLSADIVPICKTKILKPAKLEMNITDSPTSYRNILMNDINPVITKTNIEETNTEETNSEETSDNIKTTRKFVKGRWIEN